LGLGGPHYASGDGDEKQLIDAAQLLSAEVD
jgi:hypothetical protein